MRVSRRLLGLVGAAILLAFHPDARPAPEKKPRRVLLDDFEGDVSRRWQNLAPSTRQVKAGKSSGRWSGELVDAANLKLPHDWTPYATWTFTVWCQSEKATGTRFIVMLASDTAETTGPDFLYSLVTVDWTGWKQIRIPVRDFKGWEKPVGLKLVEAVAFNTSIDWVGTQRMPGTVLYIDEMYLEE